MTGFRPPKVERFVGGSSGFTKDNGFVFSEDISAWQKGKIKTQNAKARKPKEEDNKPTWR